MHEKWKKECPEFMTSERYLVLGVVDLEHTTPAQLEHRLEQLLAWLRSHPERPVHPATAATVDTRRITLASTERR